MEDRKHGDRRWLIDEQDGIGEPANPGRAHGSMEQGMSSRRTSSGLDGYSHSDKQLASQACAP